jgi:hypothetical protein
VTGKPTLASAAVSYDCTVSCPGTLVRPTPLLFGFATALPLVAQSPVPIRRVTPATATSETLGSIDELREIADGDFLVNDGHDRRLILFDATLHSTVLVDTAGTASLYPRMGKLIPWLGDSSFFYETDTRALDLIDSRGKFIRVVALPRPQDFNAFTAVHPSAQTPVATSSIRGGGR